jgi:hypothetical protein
VTHLIAAQKTAELEPAKRADRGAGTATVLRKMGGKSDECHLGIPVTIPVVANKTGGNARKSA